MIETNVQIHNMLLHVDVRLLDMKPVTDRVTPPAGADFKQLGKIDNLLESTWVKNE